MFGLVFRKKDFRNKQSLRIQILIGLLFGFLGLILMFYSIDVSKDVIIDLRNIAIISSGILGGPISAIASSLVIAIFRIINFGINKASITAFFVALFLGSVSSFMSLCNCSRLRKIIILFLFAMVISTGALTYLIHDQGELFKTLAYYWAIYSLGAILTYIALEYIIMTNLTFKIMSTNTLMAENLLDMLSTHKPDGTYINISTSSEYLLGYSQEELIGSNILKLIHPEDITLVKQFLIPDKLKHQTQTYRMRRKDGKFIWVETNAKTINIKGEILPEIVCATRDITERKAVEQELKDAKAEAEKLASIDYLTGILNRRAFIERLKAEFNRAEREDLPISLILTDIDRFKKINDTYGHNVGDLVLKEFTNCLESTCRTYDFLGRHGGKNLQFVFLIQIAN
ncbi:diguanylate cyclase [Desulfosporosinus sp. SB140]|uniref:diguanylate cyclase n=1 Tax=Desulfosporosinus paludis TaxID=3115649 RepID=UPI00388D67AB